MSKRAGKLLSPEERVIKFDCISDFARDHNLSTTHITQVLNGQRFTYKGWQVPNGFLEIKSPNNKIFKFKSLYKFAIQNELNPSALLAVLRNKLKHHKGWVLPNSNPIKLPQPRKLFEYRLISPEGGVFIFNNISVFCKRMNLERTGISKLINGHFDSINGWRKILVIDK